MSKSVYSFMTIGNIANAYVSHRAISRKIEKMSGVDGNKQENEEELAGFSLDLI